MPHNNSNSTIAHRSNRTNAKLLRENTPNPSSILQHQRIVAIEQQLLQNQRPPQQSPPSNPPQEQQPWQQVLQVGIPAIMPKSIVSVLEQ